MAEERKEVVECATNVKLLRRSGSFDKNGEKIEYSKICLSIDGTEVDLDLDKNTKNIVNGFVKFAKI